MRKLLFTFVFAVMTMVTFAQGEHMTFKGIPIQGPLNTFIQKLKDKGFYKSEFKTKNGSIILTMKKVDYRTASVIIKYNDNINEEESRKTMMDDL